jgi:hypothetical protein
VLNTLEKNYVMVRDDDGELLCLLGKDNEWYYVYYMEHCNITKSDAEALLDKAAWIALTPIIDEKVLAQYKDELEEKKLKADRQVWEDE